MLILKATQSLQVVLAAAKVANDCPVIASWVDDNESTSLVSDSAVTATNGTTAVEVVPAPTVTKRQIKAFTLRNADTVPITASVQVDVSGTPTVIAAINLAVGYSLVWLGDMFRVLTANGEVATTGTGGGGGGGGVTGNIDGGSASTVYGGTTGIDGGSA